MVRNGVTAGRVQLHAHVAPELRDQLAAVARTNDRSLAGELRKAVLERVYAHLLESSADAGRQRLDALAQDATREATNDG